MSESALPEEKSLLILDDDRPFRERLARAMQTRGFDVKIAETVRDGIAMVKENPPAFAVIDLKLDDGNGLDVGLGTQFTINDRPDRLDRYYGDDLGYAFQFFLRIRPSLHGHSAREHYEHVAGAEK